jgi:hypothetical protein
MKLKTKYVPLHLMIAEVKREKVIRKVKGVYYVCKWPEFDKDRVLSENEIFVRDKFRSLSKQASCLIQDPIIKNVYGACAKPWQSAFNVAFSHVYRSSCKVA